MKGELKKMRTVFRADDGTIFESAKECVEYEREHPALLMYGIDGKTTEPDKAYLVILSCKEGAKSFISLCKDRESPYDGIDEDSIGAFIWNCEPRYVEIEREAFDSLGHYFHDEEEKNGD